MTGVAVWASDGYFSPCLYPAGLTRAGQVALGIVALLLNALVYWQVARRRRGARA